MKTHFKSLLVVLVVVLVLVGCGDKGIVVDRTGLSPEENKIIDWKIQHAYALDWYDYTIKSLKANLDVMPKDKAKEIYQKVKPFLNATKTAIDGIKVGYLANDPDKAAEANEEYLRQKAKVLAILMEFMN